MASPKTAREEPSAGTGPRGGRGAMLLSVLVLLGLAVLLSLGFWQLHRLEWKREILARIGANMNAAPLPLPPQSQWQALAQAGNAYKKFEFRGEFDHSKEALIFRAAGQRNLGPVYHILTPLRLADGSYVIVNRGFVPERFRDSAKRSAGQVRGLVTVTGFLRLAERRNMFTPADAPDKRVWYSRDPMAIARHFKLAKASPFVIDADATASPGGWPKGGVTSIRGIPNNHLSYAWTWFGLAATLAGVYIVLLWRRRSLAAN